LLLFGDDWEEKRRRVFCFSWRKRSQKSKKKNEKSLLFWASLSLLSRGQQTQKKKKQFLLSQTAFPPVRPSVVEKDLEDVHHRGDV